MHAICQVFNELELAEYLDLMFKGKFDTIKAKSKGKLLSCVSHFIASICRNVKTAYPTASDTTLRNSIVQTFCVLKDCRSLSKIERIVYLATFIFSSSHESEELLQKKSELFKLIDTLDSVDIDKLDDQGKDFESDEDNEVFSKGSRTLRSRIPQYQVFQDIIRRAREDCQKVSVNERENKLHDVKGKCVQLFTNYLHFAPMWTSMCYPADWTGRASTGMAEAYNNLLKTHMCEKKARWNVAKYITTVQPIVRDLINKCEQIELRSALKRGSTRAKKGSQRLPPTVSSDPFDRQQEDQWNKKSKAIIKPPKWSHMSATTLKRSLHVRDGLGDNDVQPIEDVLSVSKLPMQEGKNEDSKNHFDLTVESGLPSESVINSMRVKVCENMRKFKLAESGVVARERGKYYNATDIFAASGARRLFYEDARTLTGRKWLSVNVIDYYFHIRLREIVAQVSDILEIVSVVDVLHLIEDGRTSFIRSTFKKRFLILPIYNDNRRHFQLALADTRRAVFYFFEPMGSNTDFEITTAQTYMECLTRFLADNRTWKIKLPDRPRQTDSNNCGVFVATYGIKAVESILRAKTQNELDRDLTFVFVPEFDPIAFRLTMIEDLIRLSDNMKDLCVTCTLPVHEEGSECYCCDRRIHQACITSYCIYANDKFVCSKCVYFFNEKC